MERGDQDAAVDQVQVNGHLQFVVEGGLGLGAGAWRNRAELEFTARAQLGHRPLQLVLGDQATEAVGQALGQRQHVVVGGLGHHLLQVGAHAVHGQGVGRKRRAHAAVAMAMAVFLSLLARGEHLLGHLGAAAEDAAGNAAGDRLADHEEVRVEVPQLGATTDIGGDGVGLVDDQERTVLAGQLAAFLHEARVGQDHADIGHGRLAQQGADVALGQRRFQRLDVVERDGAAVFGQVVGLADQAGAVHGLAVAAAHHHVVHGAVVAAVEHQQGLAPGHRAGPAQHVAVGVGGGGGDLPERQAEARGQQFAADHGVFARQHGGQAVVGLLGDGLGDRVRRVAKHGAGVAQAEVDVLVAVDVIKAGALGALDEQRAGRRPVGHPVHRHAGVQRAARAFGQGDGLRIAFEETGALAGGEGFHGGLADTTGSHC